MVVGIWLRCILRKIPWVDLQLGSNWMKLAVKRCMRFQVRISVSSWRLSALSAPRINSEVGKHVLITGHFTDREVRDVVIALQKGMGVLGTH